MYACERANPTGLVRTTFVMAGLAPAIQGNRLRQRWFLPLDGRIEPGHDVEGEYPSRNRVSCAVTRAWHFG